MKTTTVKKKKPFTFEGASFEDIIHQDDKSLEKEMSNDKKRNGKLIQLTSKINELNLRIMNAETKFNRSLTDPTLDSVQIGMEIRCDREELNFAMELFAQLFPKAKNTLLLAQD